MKPAFLTFALALLLPTPVMADGVLARQLHYVGETRVGALTAPITIDLDIGEQRQSVTRVLIDEHVRNRDLGTAEVTLNRGGVVPGYGAHLTFEEETLLDMLALQFENCTGLSTGDQWERSGELLAGVHKTHYDVRAINGDWLDMHIARTIEFHDGSHGSLSGMMRYNSSSVVPRWIDFSGEYVGFQGGPSPLQISAQLTADSFQP